jgi:hypothetical protein
VYQLLVERSAEKDLKRLSTEIRFRAVAAIQALAKNPRPAGSRKLAGSATTASFTKSPTSSASCASTASVIDAMSIDSTSALLSKR